MAPAAIQQPTMRIPVPKFTVSPINPIKSGTAPPPMTNPKGTARDTAMLRAPVGPIWAKAANPAGKKQTAAMGCINKVTINSEPELVPNIMVIRPVRRNTAVIVILEPNRSAAQPPTRAIIKPEILEIAIIELAMSRSIA
jgi:hypothetical protein